MCSLSLRDFRNHDAFDLDNIGNLTIFIGPNGIGKTNVLEAVQLMTGAASFRHPQISQLIKEGRENARVSVEISDGNRRLSCELRLEPGKKRYTFNGKAKGIAEMRGTLPAVVFTPDDLNLAKKTSSIKREALDDLGVQLARNYTIVRRDYEKTLRFKNRLLKEEASDTLIQSVNESLITCGSQLFCYRTVLFKRILPLVKENYASFAEEEFGSTYQPSWDHMANIALTDTTPEFERAHVKELLAESLERYATEERRRARSLIGPHNDKIQFFLAGKDASSFASQGQQRSIVLAWKLAEVEVVRQSVQVSPVLLLDDVMSELDATRRDMLVRFVTDDIQTFITATDLSSFNESLLSRANVIQL